MSQNTYSKNIFFTLLVLVACFFFTVISLTFFNFRFPSDGVYYHALADHLLDNGTIRNNLIIPPGSMLTYQNGIAYFLAIIKLFFNDFWWIGYYIFVTLAWTIFLSNFFSFIHDLLKEQIGINNIYVSSILCLIPLFHFDTFLIIGTFMNESIFLPIIWIFFIKSFQLLQKTDHKYKLALNEINKYDIYLFFFVLFFGIFFRIQSTLFIFSLLFVLLAYKNISKITFLINLSIPIVIFFLNKIFIDSPVSEFIFFSLFNPDLSNLSRLLDITTSPINFIYLSSNKFLNPIILITVTTFCLLFFLSGLKNIFHKSKKIFLFLLVLFLLNGVFLILLPMSSTRYQHLLTVPVLTIFLYAFAEFSFLKRYFKNILTSGIFFMAFMIFIYIQSYLSKPHDATTLNKINSYLSLKNSLPVDKNFIIYSNEPRYPYWYFGISSCNTTPDKCIQAKDLELNTKIFFIGSKNELKENIFLKGYEVELTNQDSNFDIWTMKKKNLTIQ